MIVDAVSPADLKRFWELLAPAFYEFERSAKGNVPAEALRAAVAASERQCWVAVADGVVRAVALTEVAGKHVNLDFCTGSGRNDWQVAMVEKIEEFARRQDGVDRVVAYCRSGWKPFLAGQGYRETHRILEKGLADG